MFAASRLANTLRVMMPYAQWAATAIQLGYVAYVSYQTYMNCRTQFEADSRNGRNRTFEETIELVIKPRRRKIPTPLSNTNETENQENQQQDVDGDNNQTSAIAGPSAIPLGWKRDCSSYSAEMGTSNLEDSGKSDEVAIVYDSSLQGQQQWPDLEPSTSQGIRRESMYHANNDTESTVTSLDSTDSNKGIISDVYTECFICARSLEDPRKPVATLPFCMHPFHQTCLDGVLKWHPRCPVCDFHIFSPI